MKILHIYIYKIHSVFICPHIVSETLVCYNSSFKLEFSFIQGLDKTKNSDNLDTGRQKTPSFLNNASNKKKKYIYISKKNVGQTELHFLQSISQKCYW